MSATALDTAPGTHTLTDGFADLVCADPLLLHAEFDALIAASWDSEPPTPPTGTRTLVGVVDPNHQRHWPPPANHTIQRPTPPRTDTQVHQRSPPR